MTEQSANADAAADAAKPGVTGAAASANAASAAQSAEKPVEKPVDGDAGKEQAGWPEDWRERVAAAYPQAEREKALKKIGRYQSLDNYLKRTNEIESDMLSGKLKRSLAENATESEIADYRKQNGVPDEATAEAYGVKWPDGYEPNEADKSDMSELLAKAHAAHLPPSVVQMFWGQYLGAQEKAQQQLYDAAVEKTTNQRAELKAEYGRDYDRNVRLAKEHLRGQIGAEEADALVGLTLADGTKIGDHPAFVRFTVAQALSQADDMALATNSLTKPGQTVADAYKEALGLRYTDPNKYNSKEHQDYLMKLSAAKARGQAPVVAKEPRAA